MPGHFCLATFCAVCSTLLSASTLSSWGIIMMHRMKFIEYDDTMIAVAQGTMQCQDGAMLADPDFLPALAFLDKLVAGPLHQWLAFEELAYAAMHPCRSMWQDLHCDIVTADSRRAALDVSWTLMLVCSVLIGEVSWGNEATQKCALALGPGFPLSKSSNNLPSVSDCVPIGAPCLLAMSWVAPTLS